MPRPMHRRSVRWSLLLLSLASALGVGAHAQTGPVVVARTQTLPTRLTNAEFWALLSGMSEPGGTFQSNNFTSNELTYPEVIGQLTADHRTGGAYIGVGPEQNFSYVAALHPDIAFIVDIRRQAVMQHLMYKAIFDLSRDRADFLALLFSKPRPAGLDSASTIAAIWEAYWNVPTDTSRFERNLAGITANLARTHGFALDSADRAAIRLVYRAFYDAGPSIQYWVGSATTGPSGRRPISTPATPVAWTVPMPIPANVGALVPGALGSLIQGKVAGVTVTRSAGVLIVSKGGSGTYNPDPFVEYYGGVNFASLTAAEDAGGVPRSFLATEAAYRGVRDLQSRNLIVPIVGDFGGPVALRAVGAYLRAHGTIVSAFYTSNVESYLFDPTGPWRAFYENAAALPVDSSSVFIRGGTSLCPMMPFLAAYRAGRIQQYEDATSCRH
jgi:hypothetical protein